MSITVRQGVLQPSSSLFGGSSVSRFAPEPKSRLGSTFQNVFRGLVSGVSDMGIGGAATLGSFENLLNTQMYWQLQMQEWTAKSNIAKSQHEIAMAPVRNIRVS
jgi:hypothetical protein